MLWKRMHHYLQDTTTPFDFNITEGTPDLEINSKCKSHSKILSRIHLQSKHRNAFGDSNIQYHDFDNGDVLTFKDKYTALLQQELQNPYWCLHDPIMTKSYQISTEMDIETMPQAIFRLLPKLIMSHTRQQHTMTEVCFRQN